MQCKWKGIDLSIIALFAWSSYHGLSIHFTIYSFITAYIDCLFIYLLLLSAKMHCCDQYYILRQKCLHFIRQHICYSFISIYIIVSIHVLCNWPLEEAIKQYVCMLDEPIISCVFIQITISLSLFIDIYLFICCVAHAYVLSMYILISSQSFLCIKALSDTRNIFKNCVCKWYIKDNAR